MISCAVRLGATDEVFHLAGLDEQDMRVGLVTIPKVGDYIAIKDHSTWKVSSVVWQVDTGGIVTAVNIYTEST